MKMLSKLPIGDPCYEEILGIMFVFLFFLGTQKISHGVRLELILLWSLLEFSLTRTRLLLT